MATWTVKLFPMYSGGGAAPMRMHDVWKLVCAWRRAHTRDLSLLALGFRSLACMPGYWFP